jgi:hypothetical protein
MENFFLLSKIEPKNFTEASEDKKKVTNLTRTLQSSRFFRGQFFTPESKSGATSNTIFWRVVKILTCLKWQP